MQKEQIGWFSTGIIMFNIIYSVLDFTLLDIMTEKQKKLTERIFLYVRKHA